MIKQSLALGLTLLNSVVGERENEDAAMERRRQWALGGEGVSRPSSDYVPAEFREATSQTSFLALGTLLVTVGVIYLGSKLYDKYTSSATTMPVTTSTSSNTSSTAINTDKCTSHVGSALRK